jgi:MFS family permease
MNNRLKSLVIGNSFFIFGGSLIIPVYALFAEDIGAGVQLMGILFAVKFIANAVADLIIMHMPDNHERTVAIYRGSMVIRGFAWLCVGLFPSIPMLLAVQIVTGLAEGFGTPAFSTLMANSLDKGKHMKQWATWDLIKNPLIAAGGVLSGTVVNAYGFGAMFYMMGSLAIIAALIPVAPLLPGKTQKKFSFAAGYDYLFSRGRPKGEAAEA